MRLIDADAMLDDVLRQIETIKALGNEELTELSLVIYEGIKQEICNQPTIDAVSVVKGEWKERETFHNADDNPIIEEWQSARCSVCNKYHTTPYMYYFSDYNFCPNCGARMKDHADAD